MGFDKQEWAQMASMADEIDPTTLLLLCEYSALMDSQGRACPKLKVLAKSTGLSPKDIRKRLIRAKDAHWLEAIDLHGKKAYRATYPN